MTRFLDPKDIEEALSEIADIVKQSPFFLALVGKIAMQIYGSDHMVAVIDVATRAYPPTLPIMSPLRFGGYTSKTQSGHPLNIIRRQDEYADLYYDAITTAVYTGLPVPVVLPEYLAAIQMATDQEGNAHDLKTLFRLDVIDLPKTRSIVKIHLGEYAARSFDSLYHHVRNEDLQ